MIFWINSPFDPLPLEGGRALRYELLARALVALGHQVVWWSSDFHHLRKAKRSLKPVYAVDGYEVRLVPTLPYRSNVGVKRIRSHRQYANDWRVLADEALKSGELEPPGAIILSMPPLGVFDAATYFRQTYGSRIIVDVQDAWPENFYALLPFIPRFLLERFLCSFKRTARRAYTGSDCISAVADKYIQLAESYGACAPTRVFPLGGVLPLLQSRPDIGEGPLRLVYVGNLGASYDLRTMLAGVGNLARSGVDIFLEIAGDGPERSAVQAAAGRSQGRIRYHGYLDETELDRVMQKCDIGIIPMRGELLVAVPNKLVDYSGYGLALINGLASETAELLRNYDCGVNYTPGDLQSFENAVKHYDENRLMLKKHKESARRMAEERFDAAKISGAMARWVIATTNGRS
jgi:glycosyltransferase involved in cell wall biosynthesis